MTVWETVRGWVQCLKRKATLKRSEGPANQSTKVGQTFNELKESLRKAGELVNGKYRNNFCESYVCDIQFRQSTYYDEESGDSNTIKVIFKTHAKADVEDAVANA